ncbi:MAG: two-component regulator propeller domain-containing protein, partial [Candidatus Promineifilaceae bacterium]
MKRANHAARLCLLTIMLLLLAACTSAEAPADSAAENVPSVVEPVPTVTAQQVEATSTQETAKVAPTAPSAKPTNTLLPVPSATTGTDSSTTGGDEAEAPSAMGAGSGFACLGSSGQGATCLLSNGEWRSFTHADSPLGGDYIIDIDTCPDGTMLLLHGSGVSAFDGQEWREFPSGWGFSSPDAIACAGEDKFWVAHFEGASYFDGTQWANFDANNMSFGDEATDLVKDVAIDGNGNLWVVTANSVASYDGQGWRIFQLGQGFDAKYFFDAITIDQKGTPWVASSDGIQSFDEDTWQLYQNRDIYTLQDLVVDEVGNVWVGTFGQGLALFDGAAWHMHNRASGDLTSDSINQLKIDEDGRLWVATAYGLFIFDGETWHAYRMENADLVDNNVMALAVSGAPALPEPEQKAGGSLQGSIVSEGTPLAGAAV